jgi:hypothetical protein
MLRGHGEIRRVSELSVEEGVRDVVVESPLTAILIGEVVEVTAHVVGQREQPTVREIDELATDEAKTSVRARTVKVGHADNHRLRARGHAVAGVALDVGLHVVAEGELELNADVNVTPSEDRVRAAPLVSVYVTGRRDGEHVDECGLGAEGELDEGVAEPVVHSCVDLSANILHELAYLALYARCVAPRVHLEVDAEPF